MTELTLADRVRSYVDGRGAVREVSMFGGVSFMLDDAMLVAVRGETGLLVRVDPARSDELLALDGADQAVMGPGRTMGPSWLTVSADALGTDEQLEYWLDVALEWHARS